MQNLIAASGLVHSIGKCLSSYLLYKVDQRIQFAILRAIGRSTHERFRAGQRLLIVSFGADGSDLGHVKAPLR